MADQMGELIKRLAADAVPVNRLRPPSVRAGLWLLTIGVIAAAVIAAFAHLDVFGRRIEDPVLATELAATLLTGIAAVLAAFELSLPDRSSAWALLPLPTLGVWVSSSGYACYRNWIVSGPAGWELGESSHCFMFILAAGIPLAVALLFVLRRAKTMTPIRVAAMGALGVGSLAAVMLQFFHPFDVTFIDLGVHLGTILLIVLGLSVAEYLTPTKGTTLTAG